MMTSGGASDGAIGGAMKKVLSLSILAAFALGSAPAHAMTPCGKRADFLKTLKDKFQEESRALGMVGKSSVMEIFTSKTGTWTILVTAPEGRSCIIAAGNSWEDVPPVKNLTAL
jgi:uncharacterized membrane protein